MKELALMLTTLILSVSIRSQNLVNTPESVIFDEVRNRYLVSNSPSGEIVIVDSVGRQSYFVQLDEGTSEGLFISGDTLWEVAGYPNRIIAYDLETGDSLLAVTDTLDGKFFDSIALDTAGNAYVAESMGYSDPNAGRIFKCVLSDRSWSIFADEGIRFPQAMRFIPEDNSLIVSSAASDPSRISRINIADSSVTYLTESAMDIIMDGITFDNFGNTYVSSWGYNAVFRYDSNFTEPPEMIASGFNGPTSLYYNKQDNVLAVPDIGNSRLVLIPMYVTINVDTAWGWPPFEVNFTGGSDFTVDNWIWDFDDGDSATVQSPSHSFMIPGVHNVTLEINAEGKSLKRKQYIVALADTLKAPSIDASADDSMITVEISATNIIPVDFLQIPIEYSGTLDLTLDSVSRSGCRTEHFDTLKMISSDIINKRKTYRIWNIDCSTSEMEPGSGPVLKLYFTVPPTASTGQSASIVLDGYSSKLPLFGSHFLELYSPATIDGAISTLICGDVNGSNTVNILDITYLISFLYKDGPPPIPFPAADVNSSGTVNILDVTYLISYLYKDGPEPTCQDST